MTRPVGLPSEKNHTRWSAASQPPLTWLLAKPIAVSYSQSNDSMVLYHSCSAPRPWSGSTGEMISSRAEVCRVHVLSWSGNNTRELCCILRSCRLYSQTNCSLYCTLDCCCYSCYSFRFSFLSHSFTVSTYARSLTLARPLTPYAHTPHTPPYSWNVLRHSYNNSNCRCWGPIDRTWTPSSVTEVACVEVFWISSELRWQRSHCRQKNSHSLDDLENRDTPNSSAFSRAQVEGRPAERTLRFKFIIRFSF